MRRRGDGHSIAGMAPFHTAASGREDRPRGAGIVVTLQDYLAGIGAWVTVITGATFVVCVLTFRRGVVGELARLRWLASHSPRSREM